MTRTLLATSLCIAVGALLAWRIGGVVGRGVLIGAVTGGLVASVGVALQLKIARTAPKRLMGAMAVAFCMKLLAALLGAVTLRFVPFAASRGDWESFLLSFAACAVIVMLIGLRDLLRPDVMRPDLVRTNAGDGSLLKEGEQA
jgi:hypothetical protein